MKCYKHILKSVNYSSSCTEHLDWLHEVAIPYTFQLNHLQLWQMKCHKHILKSMNIPQFVTFVYLLHEVAIPSNFQRNHFLQLDKWFNEGLMSSPPIQLYLLHETAILYTSQLNYVQLVMNEMSQAYFKSMNCSSPSPKHLDSLYDVAIPYHFQLNHFQLDKWINKLFIIQSWPSALDPCSNSILHVSAEPLSACNKRNVTSISWNQ